MSSSRPDPTKALHQQGTGAKGGGIQNQAIGRSRGGLTTKIVALVDALGNLTRFVRLPGQRYDSVDVEPLIAGIDFQALLACDFHIYRWRHLVENYFCKLKAFRCIATRYDKTDTSFAAMIHLVASFLAIK